MAEPARQRTKELFLEARIGLGLLLCLAVMWGIAWYEVSRSRDARLGDVDHSTVFQAQAFAENTQSIVKRLDEILLDLRDRWSGDYQSFAELIRHRQSYMTDIAFQIAVIGADGRLVFSNLAPAGSRVDLSEREHFRVHRDSGGADRLFISHPVKGKVSGKWSIQFTRPILKNGEFAGVLVVSVSPETFEAFHEKLELGRESIITMVMNTGEVLLRHPGNDAAMGVRLENTPYLAASPPQAGSFRRAAQVDGVERLYGYYRLPAYGITFVVGHAIDEVLQPWREYRNAVVLVTALASGLIAFFLLLLYRSLAARGIVEQRLRESQTMLHSAMETIGEAFVIYDRDDRLAYCNQQYRDYYKTSADLLVPGRSFEEIIRTGAARGQYKDAIGRVDAWVAERLAIHRESNMDLIQCLDDGRWLRVREHKTPEGFIVGFRIDITELYQAKEAAEAANIAKSRFLATMSHEIRTPMNGILGMAQLLLHEEVGTAERQDFARTILNSGQTLLTLLNDILDLSKIEAGKLVLEEGLFLPAQLLHEIQALFQEAANQKQLSLTAGWQGEAGARYLGDAHRLRQMLSNLVSNALKFTAAGRIEIGGREVARQGATAVLEFAVADTGIGIPAAKQALLFKPFSQGDNSTTRQFGGTGLGLSIVRSLARLMGGDVGVASEEGQGARFWFRIEVAIAEPGQDARGMERADGQPRGDGAPAAVPALTGHVLVVEDNPTNRKVIEALLAKLGLRVSIAQDGRQGLDAVIYGDDIDLVLMDIQMPVMDGLEATRQIRRWEQEGGRGHLPVIALTADAYEDDRQNARAAGMDDFLAKPVVMQTLEAMLRQWLGAGSGPA